MAAKRNPRRPTGPAPTPALGLRSPVLRGLGAVAVSAALLSGCGAATEGGNEQGAEAGVRLPDEAGHVHGVATSADGTVLVATHTGIYEIRSRDGAQSAEPISPAMDFMGFTQAGPDRFVASGHPGPGTGLPDPVGLIESTDGGRSWEPLSREGESDFHALTATEDVIVGFDGALRTSEDGVTWDDLQADIAPISLAMAEDAQTIVATTEKGVFRSTNGGEAFAAVAGAPPLVFVTWVSGGDTLYGIDMDGGVHRSDDAGGTWSGRGSVSGAPEALFADEDGIVLVTDGRVVTSTDGGKTFGSPSAGS